MKIQQQIKEEEVEEEADASTVIVVGFVFMIYLHDDNLFPHIGCDTDSHKVVHLCVIIIFRSPYK